MHGATLNTGTNIFELIILFGFSDLRAERTCLKVLLYQEVVFDIFSDFLNLNHHGQWQVPSHAPPNSATK